MNTKTMQVLVVSSSCFALIAFVTGLVACGFVESQSQEATKTAKNALAIAQKRDAEEQLYPVTNALAAELRKEVSTLRDELKTQIPKAQEARIQIAASRGELAALQQQLRESITREREALDALLAAKNVAQSSNVQPPSGLVSASTESKVEKSLSDLERIAAALEHAADKRKQYDAALEEQFKAVLTRAKALQATIEKDLKRIKDVLASVDGQEDITSIPHSARQCPKLKEWIMCVWQKPDDGDNWIRMGNAFWNQQDEGCCIPREQCRSFSLECYAVARILQPNNAVVWNEQPDPTQAVTALRRFQITNDKFVGDLGDRAMNIREPTAAKMLHRYALELDPEDPKWKQKVGRR